MTKSQTTKSKKRRSVDKAQSERFKEAARNLGADESGEAFRRAFTKIVPPRLANRGR